MRISVPCFSLRGNRHAPWDDRFSHLHYGQRCAPEGARNTNVYSIAAYLLLQIVCIQMKGVGKRRFAPNAFVGVNSSANRNSALQDTMCGANGPHAAWKRNNVENSFPPRRCYGTVRFVASWNVLKENMRTLPLNTHTHIPSNHVQIEEQIAPNMWPIKHNKSKLRMWGNAHKNQTWEDVVTRNYKTNITYRQNHKRKHDNKCACAINIRLIWKTSASSNTNVPNNAKTNALLNHSFSDHTINDFKRSNNATNYEKTHATARIFCKHEVQKLQATNTNTMVIELHTHLHKYQSPKHTKLQT